MSFAVQDKELTQTVALPNGAASVVITGFNLGHDPTKLGRHLANCEIEIAAPALDTNDLGDGATMTYIIETDDNAAFSSATSLHTAFVQTGAGGAGAAAVTKRFRLPTNVEKHVRVKATNSAAGNASDKSMTVKLLF